MRFLGRVLFITGAGSGLGRATARLFAAEGAKVVLCDLRDEEEWQRVLTVNLTGAFNTVKAALPHLLARPGGAVVNVASSAGMRGQAYAAHYAASKAGLVNFTRSIALEFASRGLRINCLAPAGIRSPLIQHFIPREDFEKQLVAYYSPPLPHQLADPADMAKAIAYLASDDAKMVVGAVLVADWGTLA